MIGNSWNYGALKIELRKFLAIQEPGRSIWLKELPVKTPLPPGQLSTFPGYVWVPGVYKTFMMGLLL
jgi:hypothetical protein